MEKERVREETGEPDGGELHPELKRGGFKEAGRMDSKAVGSAEDQNCPVA